MVKEGSKAGTVSEQVTGYLQEARLLLESLPVDSVEAVIDVLWRANRERRHVFVLGNGGSAATSSHFANDLAKSTIVPGQPRFRVTSLADSVPVMLAWANDTAFENIFAEQLENLVSPGDVVVAISGSGNSPNVLKAVQVARAHGATTVGLCGYEGGRLAGMVDHAIVARSNVMTHIEDAHHVLQHLISTVLYRRLQAEGAGSQTAVGSRQ